jgi:hypothetical protein
MRDMTLDEIALVSGAVGEMSTATRVAFGALWVVCPLAAAAFTVTYYVNRD